jgi:ankyrin repeat protein
MKEINFKITTNKILILLVSMIFIMMFLQSKDSKISQIIYAIVFCVNMPIIIYLFFYQWKKNEKERLNEELYHAIHSNNALLVMDLIEKGADVNYSKNINYSPLVYAKMHSSSRIIKILIDRGAKE